MKIIRKIDDVIAKGEEILLISLLITMIGLGFFQVVLRNLFHNGIDWADVFLRHSVLWVGLIGASLATKNERHLNMDALSRVLSPKAKNIVSIIIDIIASSFCVFFVIASFYFVKDEFSFSGWQPLFLGTPAWIIELIIPFAFTMMAIRFLLIAIEKTIQFIKENKNKDN